MLGVVIVDCHRAAIVEWAFHPTVVMSAVIIEAQAAPDTGRDPRAKAHELERSGAYRGILGGRVGMHRLVKAGKESAHLSQVNRYLYSWVLPPCMSIRVKRPFRLVHDLPANDVSIVCVALKHGDERVIEKGVL